MEAEGWVQTTVSAWQRTMKSTPLPGARDQAVPWQQGACEKQPLLYKLNHTLVIHTQELTSTVRAINYEENKGK